MNFSQMFGKAKHVRANEEYYFPYVRKTFGLSSKAIKAQLLVNVMGFAEIYLNGKKINDDLYVALNSEYCMRRREDVNEPMRKSSYFEEEVEFTNYVFSYDVTDFLDQGKNCFGAILAGGYFRTEKDKHGHFQNFGATKIAFRIIITHEDGTVTEVCSDQDCKWKESFLLRSGVYHEEQDENAEIKDFSLPNYDDSKWKAIVVEEELDSKYLMKDCPSEKIIRYITPKLIKEGAGYKIYDVGENTTGFPIIKSSSINGDTIECMYGEVLDEDDEVNEFHSYSQKSVFITDGRTEHYIRFTWHGFRYFKISTEKGDNDISCSSVAVVHADVKNTSTFNCSDDTINWIYDAFVRSQLTNYHCGAPTDCPQIERRGYTGDGQLLSDVGMMMFDSKDLYRKWMRDIADTQDKKSGHVQYTAPTFVGCGGGTGGWGIAIVNVPYNYYRNFGDKGTLETYYDNMLGYLKYLKAHSENGLVTSDQPNAWFLGDWCAPKKMELSVPFANTCFHIVALEKIIKISKIIGKTERIEEFIKRRDELRKIVTETFMDENGDFCANVQGANAFAINAGLGDERTLARMVENYTKEQSLDTGIFATEYVIDILCKNGYQDLAYELLTSDGIASFKRWKEQGETTLLESWNNARSHNHPMFGAVVKLFFQYILGINQKEEGAEYKNVVINPKSFEKISFAEGSLETASGKISVGFNRTDKGTEFNISIPNGVTAEFVFGKEKFTLKEGTNSVIL